MAWYKDAIKKGPNFEKCYIAQGNYGKEEPTKLEPKQPNVLEFHDGYTGKKLVWVTSDLKMEVAPEVRPDEAALDMVKLVTDTLGDRDRAQQLKIRSALIHAIPALKLLMSKVQEQDLHGDDHQVIKEALTRAEEIFK